MGILPQLIVNGLIAGAIYALVAVGFSLIYSVCRFVHFAHGATVATSAYAVYFLFNSFNQVSGDFGFNSSVIPGQLTIGIFLNFGLAVVLTLAFAGLLGWLINFVIYERLRNRKASNTILLMASIALLILLESLILILFGADVKTIELLKIGRGLEISGAIITPLQVVIIIVAILLLIAFWFLMKRTKVGKAMRAVADNKEVAEIVGIPARQIYVWSFIIGSVIAGVAGILVGLEQNLEPTMGTNLMIKGFTAAIIGGIGSVPGAVLGSFLLGIVENFGIWFLPSGYKDAIAFIVLFLFLLIRPQGILGIRSRD
jgi:branched-chain amino acid transport system permease protein